MYQNLLGEVHLAVEARLCCQLQLFQVTTPADMVLAQLSAIVLDLPGRASARRRAFS